MDPCQMPENCNRRPSTPPPEESLPCPVNFKPFVPEDADAFLHHYSYIHLDDGPEFWMYPIKRTKDSMYGYFWNGANWVYGKMAPQRIRCIQ